MKKHGNVTEYQAMNMELLHMCVSQQNLWHTMIEAQCEDMKQMNSPHDIFIRFYH